MLIKWNFFFLFLPRDQRDFVSLMSVSDGMHKFASIFFVSSFSIRTHSDAVKTLFHLFLYPIFGCNFCWVVSVCSVSNWLLYAVFQTKQKLFHPRSQKKKKKHQQQNNRSSHRRKLRKRFKNSTIAEQTKML